MGITSLDLLSDRVTISVPDNVLFQELDEEVVLLNVENGEYYGLNQVGSSLWRLLRQGLPMGRVLAALLEEYDVSPAQLGADVYRFMSVLHAKGLIEVKGLRDSDAG